MLQAWVDGGWLRKHKHTAKEISRLLEMADRDIAEADSRSHDPDWKFNIAYTAILSLALAVLAAEGYRTGHESHHYYVLQSLEYTIKLDEDLVYLLDKFRTRWNRVTYEQSGWLQTRKRPRLLIIARELREKVITWLSAGHPELLNE